MIHLTEKSIIMFFILEGREIQRDSIADAQHADMMLIEGDFADMRKQLWKCEKEEQRKVEEFLELMPVPVKMDVGQRYLHRLSVC